MLIDKIIERIENEKQFISKIKNTVRAKIKETPILQAMSNQAKIIQSF